MRLVQSALYTKSAHEIVSWCLLVHAGRAWQRGPAAFQRGDSEVVGLVQRLRQAAVRGRGKRRPVWLWGTGGVLYGRRDGLVLARATVL